MTPQWPRRSGLALNLGFWTIVGAFQASNWIFSPISEIFPYPGRLLATAFINAYLWALLTPLLFRLASSANPAEQLRIGRIAVILAIGVGTALAMALLAAVTHHTLLPRPWEKGPMGPWAYLGSLWQFIPQQGATFGVVMAAGIATDSTKRHRLREREAIELKAQQADLHAQLAQARLTALQTRLNPHFLFNTLNAVSALVATDPKGVRDMLALLSELLRHALKDAPAHEIPLHEELRLVRLYLEILEIRYRGQLDTTVTADAESAAALVPNMILQPLVENAMKHGLNRTGGRETIEVTAHRADGRLVLRVVNSGALHDGAPRDVVAGVGLELTRARLRELYGAEQAFALEPRPEGGMMATLELPFHLTSAHMRGAPS